MSPAVRETADSATLNDYRWLIGSDGARWLEVALAEFDVVTSGSNSAAGGESTLRLQKLLRKELSAEQARLTTLQLELRSRARDRFHRAEQMFFTRLGLEQATDEVLAAYKAKWFSSGGELIDLCCGIGGDLIAMARRGRAKGIDLDPIAALLAEANARACGLDDTACTAEPGDANSIHLSDASSWHCDPDRRATGSRTTKIEFGEPSLAAIERLLRESPQGSIKLAPAAQVPPAWQERAELEWLGSRGECRQQVAWFGALARHPGNRSATIVNSAGAVRTVTGETATPCAVATQLGAYLYEPQAAILAAGLEGTLCGEHMIAPVSAGIAYLTGDRPIADSALAAFEVRDVLPFDRKQLRAYCREQGIGRLEVKKRGLELDPEQLRKQVIGDGDEEAVLIVSPVAGSIRVIVARRVKP